MKRPRAARCSGDQPLAFSARPKKRERTEPKNFLLGECIVQPQLNKILIGNWVRHLEPKCMDLLVFFSRHPLEVHSRERLVDEVWQVNAVASTTLTHAIGEIRKALDDDARRPRYIETIHRRGYRLLISPEDLPDENLVAMGDLTRRLNSRDSQDVLAFDNRRVSAIHEVRGTRNGQRFSVVDDPQAKKTRDIDGDSAPTELVFRISIKLPQWFRSMLRR